MRLSNCEILQIVNQEAPDSLQEVGLVIIDNDDCNTAYQQIRFAVSKKMICATAPLGMHQDIC